jgi:tetratricopeptide (TPR) repeat protein
MAPEALAQARPGRPGLIRDTDTAEGKNEADPTKPKEYNPLEAERHYRVAEFYLKKKNYGVAIQRYVEAIEYQPNLVKAYDALGKVYERTGAADKAKQVYRDFLAKNPDSPKKAEFQARLAKLGN